MKILLFFLCIITATCSAQDYLKYQSPFSTRYANSEMSKIFSLQNRHEKWRQIWTALAQAEKDLGLPITDEQVQELRENIEKINFDAANAYEKELKHDVMAHVHAYGDQCPKAKPIIHLGATSCTITDNADLLIYREAMLVTQKKMQKLLKALGKTALKHKDLPCLSYTHFQAAQPTTLGKRMSLWLQDFYLDYCDLAYRLENTYFLGIKGTTGTQASFVELFDGNHEKVKLLEIKVGENLGYNKIFPISGQTYSRKQDKQMLDVLSSIAVSAHKMSTDLRLHAHMKEIEEPFGQKQIGSSAMPYKRNPMENERICSLAKYVMSLAQNPSQIASTQWFERTLDDSANRRLSIPEAFLAIDTMLDLLINISSNMVVYPVMIEKHLNEELPFMTTENILMASVKKGGDRQVIHERIREHSQAVGLAIKQEGKPNTLLERLAQDPAIPLSQSEMQAVMKENLVGRSPQQVEEFIKEYIEPITDHL